MLWCSSAPVWSAAGAGAVAAVRSPPPEFEEDAGRGLPVVRHRQVDILLPLGREKRSHNTKKKGQSMGREVAFQQEITLTLRPLTRAS